MSVVDKPIAPMPDAGEFAPMVPERIRRALDPFGQALWTEAMARPDGWELGPKERVAATMRRLTGDARWTVNRVRTCIQQFLKAKLYRMVKDRDWHGRYLTRCSILSDIDPSLPDYGTPVLAEPAQVEPDAFPQVVPGAGLPGPGEVAPIPSTKEKGKERRGGFLARRPRLTKRGRHGPPHTDTDCPRDKEGLPCRECGKLRTAQEAAEKRAAATDSVTRPYAASVAAVLDWAPCKHGNPVGLTSEERPLCAACRLE